LDLDGGVLPSLGSRRIWAVAGLWSGGGGGDDPAPARTSPEEREEGVSVAAEQI
jgi:hypothetical protein